MSNITENDDNLCCLRDNLTINCYKNFIGKKKKKTCLNFLKGFFKIIISYFSKNITLIYEQYLNNFIVTFLMVNQNLVAIAVI